MEKMRTKDLIIQTASELFYRKGYNLTGINEIIAEAGIAKATLYSHFKSKEDLCLAYLNARNAELIRNLREYCAAQPQGDARILAILEFLLSFFQQDEFNGCWCIRTVAEIPRENERIRNCIKSNKKDFLKFITQIVTQNKPNLELPAQMQLAKRIYLLYESAIAESHLHGEAWPIHENLAFLKSII